MFSCTRFFEKTGYATFANSEEGVSIRVSNHARERMEERNGLQDAFFLLMEDFFDSGFFLEFECGEKFYLTSEEDDISFCLSMSGMAKGETEFTVITVYVGLKSFSYRRSQQMAIKHDEIKFDSDGEKIKFSFINPKELGLKVNHAK